MKTLIKVIVSILLLAVAIYLLDWDALKNLVLRVNLWIFFLGILITFSTFIILGIRWHLLLRKIGAPKPLENIKHYLYATFLNSFSPANVGGDIYRFFTLKNKTPDKLVLVVVLLKERVLGILSFFLGYLLFIVGLGLARAESLIDSHGIFLYSGGAVFLATALLFVFPQVIGKLLKWKWIRERDRLHKGILRLHDALKFDSMVTFAKLIGLSFGALFLWILTAQLMAFDLGIQIPYLQLGAVVILVELIRLIPITIQGLGLREGVYAYLFQMLGKSPEDGFVLGTVAYLALSISLLLSGLIGITSRADLKRKRHDLK